MPKRRSRLVLVASLTAAAASLSAPVASALVAPQWSDPVQVGDDTYIFTPEIGLSDDGSQAVAAWSDNTNLVTRAAIVSGASATWGADTQVTSAAPGNVELVVSGNGDVALAAWRENSNLAHYAIGTVSGTSVAWSSPVSLGCNCLVQPALSADGTRATLVYEDTVADAILSKSGIISGGSATWSSTDTISTGSSQVGDPLVGLSADGQTVFAFFAADTSGFSPIYKSVIGTVSGSTPTVTWGSVTNVSAGTRSYSPQLSFARDGSTALVAWWDIVAYPDTRVFSRTAEVTGTSTTWSAIEAHTGAGTADSPRVALSSDGSKGLIGWSRSAYGSDTRAVITRAADISGSTTTWSAPTVLPGSEGVGSMYAAGMAADASLGAVMWASVVGGVVAPTVSATTLTSGLDWDPGTALNGSLSPASAAYPALAVSADGQTAAAAWTIVGTPYEFYVNTGSLASSPAPEPPPAAPIPATKPMDVSASAGDASASVSWSAPASAGSYPVTNYQVTSSPGGRVCLTSGLSCEVSRLTNGTAYTFTVKALTGAGWSPASDPSNVVTPVATPRPTITITGAREGKRIAVTGAATVMGMGAVLTPWVRLSGQSSFAAGSARVLVSLDGTFQWSRTAERKVSVYMQTPDGVAKSNTVTIEARSRT